jgi:transcriptional regulator with XRE-family HTH domain
MAIRPIEMGPVGRRLAANLAPLRKQRDLTQQDLGKRLKAVGHPMTASAISRIEQADRRADVDDLVAFAIALDVTPNHLLLTPDASSEPLELTREVTVTRERAWQWATGELPLDDRSLSRVEYDETTGERRLILGDLSEIQARQPHHPIDPMPFGKILKHIKALAAVRRAVQALEAEGLTRRQIFNGLGMLDIMADARSNLEDLGEE